MKYFFILLVLTLASCGSIKRWHCRSCLDGAKVFYDTLHVYDTLKIAGAHKEKDFDKGPVNWDSLRNANPDQFPQNPPCPELPPVMEVKKGNASATITQTDKGLNVKLDVKDSIVYREKTIEVPVKIECDCPKTGWPLWKVIVAITGALFLGALLMRVFRG